MTSDCQPMRSIEKVRRSVSLKHLIKKERFLKSVAFAVDYLVTNSVGLWDINNTDE